MVSKNLMILALVAIIAFVGLGINVPGSVGGTPPAGSTGGVCTIPLSSAQTLQAGAYDADKPGTSQAPTAQFVYLNAAAGQLNPGNFTTQPGKAYTYYATKANVFAAKQDFTTPCNEVSPTITALMKTVDTSITESVINSKGLTENTAVANETLIASGTATVHVRLTPSALYKHLSGATNQYSVYINATNATDWDTSGFSLVGIDGQNCNRASKPNPSAITKGQVLVGFDCTGDFSGTSNTYREMALTVKSGSLATMTYQPITFNYVGWDYYTNTITGALETGPVKNDGTAIQALQNVAINFN